jgi:hypothetical protein
MITLEKMTDEEFERHTLELLREELGPDGLARLPSGKWKLYTGQA